MNPVAQTINVRDGEHRYTGLMLWCPGCEYADPEDGHPRGGLHLLPVIGDTGEHPRWDWDGNLEAPTLSPSILTRVTRGEGVPEMVCHSFLRAGVFEFLGDCTHDLAGQHVSMPPLPDWVVR